MVESCEWGDKSNGGALDQPIEIKVNEIKLRPTGCDKRKGPF